MRNEHVDAILAKINTVFAAMTAPQPRAWTASDAPKSGSNYVIVSLSRRYGGNPRNAGVIQPSAWRVTTRAIGTGEDNARVLLDKCAFALEDQTITVGSVTSTPIAFEAEDPTREDEFDSVLWSGLISWTYSF